ncbi:hypothetical protein AKUH3B204M_12710 [Apilactobacillus kunkeei]|uniref:KxYKxGKxW signal peptide domain-containing protein n=1 Tax=Apilactobacillus kunkeei TaxID=148814 RepID=UPI00200A7254|nr:KxYKxGKxW signal peptide domain-containing protein [Apilactobacillus kunkeei]MCK8629104.1 KxYKxGKxW signal peptide domain-containing protein [Apilactobacillus kunkeei]CAI2653446.1 hypothetical protein AKUH3B204M_12710 [Apilactobacillus kunkeei]CAI2654485.1 hypothetical protein AKUA1802_13370 [Apilactobacillus kunkeei]CAI2655986.1 hypothetical protein AKUA0901_13360 [Apilactobacillus kunkeei]CAI2658296.1 hypothetical protein AKUA1201_13350 [Apilactobacillus kunkeei]
MENRKLHYKMYKSGKTWVVAGICTISFGLAVLNNNVQASANESAEHVQNVGSNSVTVAGTSSNVKSGDNNDNQGEGTTQSGASISSSGAVQQSSSASTSSSAQQSVGSSSVTVAQQSSSSNSATSAEVKPNDPKYDFNYSPTFNPKFEQNFHYNNPQGYSNDIQSIVPKYGSDGKVQYWEVYYLGTQYPNNLNYSSHWYGLKTTDFVNFTPISNPDNPASKDNVAIPDAAYKDAKGNSVEVADNNKNGIPWEYVATGSVISNNAINNKPLFTKDEWGNLIDSDAELAYFSTFGNNGTQNVFLAYKNKDSQFHPYSSEYVVSSSIVGKQPSADFRDPYVTNNGKQLIMYVAGGLNHKMFTLTSSDGVNWKHNIKDDVQLDGLVETPNIQTISGQTVMIYSAQPSISNKLGFTKYVTGYIDNNGIFKRTGAIKNLDDGSDLYAGNYVKVDNDTVANVGWLGDWIYTPSIWNESTFPGVLHAGSFTMSRALQYNGKEITSIPVEPGQSKLDSKNKVKSTKDVIKVQSSKKVEIDYADGNKKNVYLVRNSHNKITISFSNNKMTVTRKEDKNVVKGMNLTLSTSLNNVKIKRVILYVDNSSVEIYLPQIKKMFTLEDIANEKSNQAYSLKTDKPGNVNIYSFTGSVDSNYVNGLYSSVQNRFNKMKSRFGSETSQLSSVYYANRNLKTAMSYINKAKNLNGDSTANVYLAMANYYLSNANYWNDESNKLKTDASSVADRYVARLGKAKSSYNKSEKELSAAKRKMNKKHSRANVKAYNNALTAYRASQKTYYSFVNDVYKQSSLALKDTKRKAAITKRKVSSDNAQLRKLKKTMKKHHSKKQAKKLSTQYKKLNKLVKSNKMAYSKLVNKEKAIVRYSAEISTINRDSKALKTAESKAAKAKAVAKKHKTRKNKAAYAKLAKKVNRLTNAISNAQSYIRKNSSTFK